MNEESDGHPMQCNTTAVRFHAPLVVVHNFSSFFSFQREKEFEFLSTRRTEMRTIRKKKKNVKYSSKKEPKLLQETDASIRHIICWPIIEWNDPCKKLIAIQNFEWHEMTIQERRNVVTITNDIIQVELKSHGKIRWPNWRISRVLTSRLFHSWNKEIVDQWNAISENRISKTKTFSEAAIANLVFNEWNYIQRKENLNFFEI